LSLYNVEKACGVIAGFNLEPLFQWFGKRVWSSEGTMAILILVILNIYSYVLVYKSTVQSQVLTTNNALITRKREGK
jgi:hypothetical protein